MPGERRAFEYLGGLDLVLLGYKVVVGSVIVVDASSVAEDSGFLVDHASWREVGDGHPISIAGLREENTY